MMTLCMHGVVVSLTGFALPSGPPAGFVSGTAYRCRSHGLSYVPMTYTTSLACKKWATFNVCGQEWE